MMNMDVILVNERDNVLGYMEKMEAHQKGLLHRAFSIFILNDTGEMLLQKRALSKYHSPGLWTNACCSHPQPFETTIQSAKKRLLFEMGFSTKIEKIFDFTYKTTFDNGLTEYEYDHVFIGKYSGEVFPNSGEVEEYCYRSISDIKNSLITHSEIYTEWFKIAFPEIEKYIVKNINKIN